jgi:3-oxoacyl-[acyl-carrier-protein] synthase II
MKAPQNRRVVVLGYWVSTPLGHGLAATWERAARGESGIRRLTRADIGDFPCHAVGEIPDYDPLAYDFVDEKEVKNWNAKFVVGTMIACHEAVRDAGIDFSDGLAERAGCLIGSALNGLDAYGIAVHGVENGGPTKVSPFLLPNVCANLPAGKASMLLGFKGPIFSPGGACASGNHCLGIGARMIQAGHAEVMLAGGVEFPLLPPIIYGFGNMNATIRCEDDRCEADPGQASRPFSIDRRGFALSEGVGVLVIASLDFARAHGLSPRAEILGIGMSSDAHHYTRPNKATILSGMREAIDDAGLSPADIQAVNAHAASTKVGDRTEIECLREVFGDRLPRVPVSANKSMLGHSLGATAAIEAVLAIEGMRRGVLLPTINHLPDPEFAGVDVVPNAARERAHEIVLSNAFGFGGTNGCVVLRGLP